MDEEPRVRREESSPSTAGLTEASIEDLDEDVWTAAPLSSSNPLHRQMRDWDLSLRCPCCSDFFRIPVSVNPCHHTFCSECIRSHIKSCLSRTTRTAFCPVCRDTINTRTTEDRYLVPNRTIGEMCGKYQSLRDDLRRSLCQLASEQMDSPATGSPSNATSGREGGDNVSNNRMSPRLDPSKTHVGQEQKDLNRSNKENDNKMIAPSRNRLKRRPAVIYKFLNRKRLIEMCRDDGLATTGTETELRARHEEFSTLYNSECDSFSPRPVSELVAEISRRERARQSESMKSRFNGVDQHMGRLKRSREQAGHEPSCRVSSGNSEFDAQLNANFSKLTEKARKSMAKNTARPTSSPDNKKVQPNSSLSSPATLATGPSHASLPPEEAPEASPADAKRPEATPGAMSDNRIWGASRQPNLPSIPAQKSLAPSEGHNHSFANISTSTGKEDYNGSRGNLPKANTFPTANKRPKRQKKFVWQCRKCTFINETESRGTVFCKICDTVGNRNDTPSTVAAIDV